MGLWSLWEIAVFPVADLRV